MTGRFRFTSGAAADATCAAAAVLGQRFPLPFFSPPCCMSAGALPKHGQAERCFPEEFDGQLTVVLSRIHDILLSLLEYVARFQTGPLNEAFPNRTS